MGTRHLIEVKANKEIKIAQYGQWDGYPTGQGEEIAEFLRKADLNLFKDKLSKIRFLSDEEVDKKCDKFPDEWMKKYPELSRDTGAEILELVYLGEATELVDNSEFKKDKISCEYSYLIDLDKNQVKIKGKTSKTLSFKEFIESGKMQELEEIL